jgi:glycosyltransferase involved in cell wall biosynthesis
MTTPAIFFHPDQIEGKGKDLVGRRSAGQSFLKGWLQHAGGPEVLAVTETPDAARQLELITKELGETRPVKATSFQGGADFTRAGTIYFPTPGYQRAAWLRQRWGQKSCSLVGITHTVSTRRIIEGFHHQHAEPVEDWDAVICTSRAVHSVVQKHFAIEAEYFRSRFGATRVPQPRLPVIPLGIETADFAPLPGARARMRAQFGVPEDGVVIMTMGRLSVIEKANPVPLFIALEIIAQQIKVPVHLWMVGWASRPEEEKLHVEGAATIAKSVTARVIDGRDADIRRNIWAGADIFTLPTDSIQETFGLVPVEAMAAGLPVVMPDWDGYRDTMVHGQTGLAVPTRMAPPGHGTGLARRFADDTDVYLPYLTLVQTQVQVDVPDYARALAALIQNPEARGKLGQQAQAHARARFDWKAVIPQYLALADELAGIRARGSVTSAGPLPSGPLNPMEVDPFHLYSDYPTAVLDPDAPLSPGIPSAPGLLGIFDKFSGRELYRRRSVDPAFAERVLAHLRAATAPITTRTLAADLGKTLVEMTATVLYLAKSDLIRLPQLPPRR